MDVMTILHLLVTPILLAAWMCFTAAAAKKAEPALAAAIYFAVLLGISIYYENEDISFGLFLHMSGSMWMYILLDSVIGVISMMMLFMAMKNAEIGKVHPAYLAMVGLSGFTGIFTGKVKVSPSSIIMIVLLLSGFIVIFVAEKEKMWALYIFIILALTVLREFIGRSVGFTSVTVNERLVEYVVEIAILVAIIITKGGFDKFHSISFVSGMYLILGTLCTYASDITTTSALKAIDGIMPEYTVYILIAAAPFFTAGLAYLISKEKFTGNKLIGTALIVAALEIDVFF